jgi:hypothetical protein
LQFVRFDTGAGFARPLSELAAALRVDLQWIREHTRLGEIATLGDGKWVVTASADGSALTWDVT